MAKYKKEQQNAEKQKVTDNGGVTQEDGRKDGGKERCDNMAVEDDAGTVGTSSEKAGEAADAISETDEAAIWKDKYLRLSAEYENYRKRTLKEKLELIDTGGEDIVKSMLEVLDDMDRALAALQKTEEMEAVKQGVMMISTKLNDTLRGKGLCEIDCMGSELDTDLHEAVAKIEVGEKEMKGKIVDVIQKGYKLKDKIIRYAKVVVGQ